MTGLSRRLGVPRFPSVRRAGPESCRPVTVLGFADWLIGQGAVEAEDGEGVQVMGCRRGAWPEVLVCRKGESTSSVWPGEGCLKGNGNMRADVCIAVIVVSLRGPDWIG